MLTLGQIAYEAHFGETAGDYALQSEKQQERWQRSAEAVLAAAREREAGLAALVEWAAIRLNGVTAETFGEGDVPDVHSCLALAVSDAPAALDDLRRRERSIGAEEELRRLARVNQFRMLDQQDLLERVDAIGAERAGEGGA